MEGVLVSGGGVDYVVGGEVDLSERDGVGRESGESRGYGR